MPNPVIRPSRQTLHGQWSSSFAPCATVPLGGVVEWRDVLDVSWGCGQHDRENMTREKWGPRESPRDDGPAMHGPVYVEGIRAGETLAVTIESIVPGPYGWTIGGLGPFNEALVNATGAPHDQFLLLWDLDVDSMTAVSEFGLRLPMDPFFGTIGICPAGEGPHVGWFPTVQGGNMDCAALTVGSTIYFPVAHDGALFSLGDAHARQGDGEASGSAIEMMVSHAKLRFDRADFPVATVTADTPNGWVTCGFDRDLDVATGQALSAMLDLMERKMGVSRSHAMALASSTVDLRITQLVNGVRGVHARLDPEALGGWCLSPVAPDESGATIDASSLVDDATASPPHDSFRSPRLIRQGISQDTRHEVEAGRARRCMASSSESSEEIVDAYPVRRSREKDTSHQAS